MSSRLFAFAVCCLVVATWCPASDIAAPSHPSTTDTTFDWMPSWREKADCGPNALYVLMNLAGHRVTLEEVKARIPLDTTRGCSMESLVAAAGQLGFSLEARFVKPSDVCKLPHPFILHGITSHEKNLGHFIVVVDFDAKKRNFALIDPIRETFTWNPEASALYEYSGYVLIPRSSSTTRWNHASGIALIVCGIGIVLLFYFKRQLVLKAPNAR